MRWIGLVGLLAACNPNGYPYLGEKIDNVTPLDATANLSWIGAHADGSVEWMTFAPSFVEGEDPQFTRVIQGFNTSTMETGTVVVDTEAGIATLSVDTRYIQPDEGDVPLLSRTGSFTEFVDEDIELSVSFDRWNMILDGEKLYFLDELHRYMNEVQDPDLLFSFFQVVAAAVQPRIGGFGGPGMTSYFGKDTNFTGRISGQLRLRMDNPLKPKTGFFFESLSDMSGCTLNGSQRQVADIAGNGYMWSELGFSFVPFFPLARIPDIVDAEVIDQGPYSGQAILSGSIYYGEEDGDPAINFEGPIMVAGTYELRTPAGDFDLGVSDGQIETLWNVLADGTLDGE